MTNYVGQQAPTTPPTKVGDTVAFGGRLTRDPELRQTQGGHLVTNLDFAMDSTKQGTVFAQVTYWGAKAQIACDFLKKGMPFSGVGRRYYEEFTRQDGTSGKALKYEGLTLSLDVEEVVLLVTRIVDKKLSALKPKTANEGSEKNISVAPSYETDFDISNNDDLPF